MTAAVMCGYKTGWNVHGESPSAKQEQWVYPEEGRAESTTSFAQSGIQRNLISLYEECSRQNWDGYGAKPISLNGILQAAQLAGHLSPEFLPSGVSPEADGEVALDWTDNEDRWLSISFGDGSNITYAGVLSRGKKIHGVDILENNLPDYLLQAISQVSKGK